MVDINEVSDDASNDERVQAKHVKEVLRTKQKKSYIKYTDIHKDTEEEQGAGIGEMYQLVAICFGAVCYFMKMKWAAWATLYFFYCSVINFGHHTMIS